MANFLDICRFTPTAGGTTDWTYLAAVTGYQSPTAAGVIAAAIYRYRAESADLSQWEMGYGAYNGGVFARATVLYNSSGTGLGPGQSGAGTKINFTTVPQVAVVLLAEDLAPTPKIFVAPGYALQMFGDSITTGTGASVAAVTGYAARFAQTSNTTLTNYAVSGTASNRATKDAFANVAAFQRRSNLLTWAASHNDVYRGGAAAKTIAKLKGELRSFIANSFLATAVPTNDASITKTGTWTAGTAGTLNEKAVNLAAGAGREMFTQTANDTLSGSFTGDNFVVGCFNADAVAVHVGAFTVAIDGATSGPLFATYNGDGNADGVSDGTYNNQLTHEAVILYGLGAGTHTFVIKATGAAAGFPVYIDYVGTLLPTERAAPLIVSENSRPNATGYSLGGGVWSPFAFDVADAAIHSVVNEFVNFPIGVARVSTFQNTLTDISGDNEHPNDLGHLHLQQAFSDVIALRPTYFAPYTDLSKSADQSITSGTYNAVTWNQSASDDDALHSNSVNTSRITLPFAGTFRFEGTIGFLSNATGIREAFLYKNGGQVKMIVSFPALNGDDTVLPFFTKISGVAGDYFELMAIQSSGGALNVKAAQTFLSVTAVR